MVRHFDAFSNIAVVCCGTCKPNYLWNHFIYMNNRVHFYSTFSFAVHRHSSYTFKDVLKQADSGAVKDGYLFVDYLFYS